MSVLSSAHVESLRALSDILIPHGGTLEASGPEAGVPQRIAAWIEGSSPAARRTFRLLVSAWNLGPLAAPGFLKPFHRLDREHQEKWVEASHHSKRIDRRLPLTYLKQMVFLAYASNPEIEEAIGFDYTCRLEGEPHARLETTGRV